MGPVGPGEPLAVILRNGDSCRVFLCVNVPRSYRSSSYTSAIIIHIHHFISVKYLCNKFSEVELLGQRVCAFVIVIDAVKLLHAGNSSFLESF